MNDETIIYQKDPAPPAEPKPATPPPDPNEPAKPTAEDQRAEVELLKSSGGDPFTQESD